MPRPCDWCGTRASCPECRRTAREGGVVASHEPSVSRYAHGCRCDGCRAVWREHRQAQRRAAGVGQRREGRTCGLRATYVAGCRCQPCRDAHAAYQRDYQRRR